MFWDRVLSSLPGEEENKERENEGFGHLYPPEATAWGFFLCLCLCLGGDLVFCFQDHYLYACLVHREGR